MVLHPADHAQRRSLDRRRAFAELECGCGPGRNRDIVRLGYHFHRRDEAVAAAGNRLDVPRRLGIVAKCGPHLLDRVIDSLLDIDEDVSVPQPFSNLFAIDHLARARHEEGQELQALRP